MLSNEENFESSDMIVEDAVARAWLDIVHPWRRVGEDGKGRDVSEVKDVLMRGISRRSCC